MTFAISQTAVHYKTAEIEPSSNWRITQIQLATIFDSLLVATLVSVGILALKYRISIPSKKAVALLVTAGTIVGVNAVALLCFPGRKVAATHPENSKFDSYMRILIDHHHSNTFPETYAEAKEADMVQESFLYQYYTQRPPEPVQNVRSLVENLRKCDPKYRGFEELAASEYQEQVSRIVNEYIE